MANPAAAGKGVAKQKQILEQFFPDWENEIWKWSKDEPGFTAVPRTLNLIAVLLKKLREQKREDPSMVYLDLWLRAFNGLVEVKHEEELAYSCGFTAERGVRTWRERIAWLQKKGFIRTAERWGSLRYIFLRNPDMVVSQLDEQELIPSGWKNEYEMRMKDTKAKRWELNKEIILNKRSRKKSLHGTVMPVPFSRTA